MKLTELKARLSDGGIKIPAGATEDDVKALARKAWDTDGELGRKIRDEGFVPAGITEGEIAAKMARLDRRQAIVAIICQRAYDAGLHVPDRAEAQRPIGRAELVNLLGIDGVIIEPEAPDSKVKEEARKWWGRGTVEFFSQGGSMAGITRNMPGVASRMEGGLNYQQAAAVHLSQLSEDAGLRNDLPLGS